MSDSEQASPTVESPASPSVASPPPAAAQSGTSGLSGTTSASTAPAAPVGDLCPYCGEFTERSGDGSSTTPSGQPAGTPRCRACLAFLDPLSKQVTQGHMGPWALRDTTRPFYPGVAFDVLAVLIGRGEVTRDTVIRGPGTGQFWMLAGRTPGVAHLLGLCHACGAPAKRGDQRCAACSAAFPTFPERDRLGLPGASVPKRISAFATDEELRAGGPAIAPSLTQGAAAGAVSPPTPMPMPPAMRAQREPGLSPLEISLGEEVAHERKKTIWLMIVIATLIVVNLAVAAWALMGGTSAPKQGARGGGQATAATNPAPNPAPTPAPTTAR